MSDPERAAYTAGLAMLARRELTERQVRERLAKRDHPADAIDAAVARLRESGFLDDRRVARSAARVEAQQRSRGRYRVQRKLESLGLSPEVVSAALDEVFGELDERALLDKVLTRRLRGGSIVDAAHLRRLHQQLLRQGFSSAAIVAALRARSRGAELDAPLPDAE
jgi:regulatory protein